MSVNSPRCPVLWFVYILMHGREEWVLAQIVSQSNCVERLVRPMFPDYLSIFGNYGANNDKRIQSIDSTETFANGTSKDLTCK